MSNSVTVDLKGNNQQLNKTLKDSEGLVAVFGKGVQTAFYAISVAQKAFAAGSQIFNWAAGFIQAAAESQEAEATLAAALEATGHAAGFQTEQLVKLSEHLQDVTKFEAEVTQGAMAILATFRNVRGDVFIEATKAAQDMATIMKTDLSSASMQLGKALNDPTEGLTALTRAGVTFTDAQKATIKKLQESGDMMGAQKVILAELAGEFGGAAEKIGKTFAGRMEQMKNRFGDISEDIGLALMPVMEKLVPVIEGFADVMEQVVQPVLEAFVDWLINAGTVAIAVMRPTFEWLGEQAVTTFTAIETVLYNFGDYWQLTMDTVALAMVKFVNDTVHFFTNTLPTAIKWFVDNAGNLLMDYFNFQKTMWTNVAVNAKDFMLALWATITGGDYDWKMTGLLEGFESTLKELPQFQERLQSATEQVLQNSIDHSAERIGSEFNRRYAKNKEIYENLFKSEKKELEALTNDASKQFDIDKAKPDKVKKEKADKPDKDAKDDKGEKGAFVGLEDLGKRIAEAAGANDQKVERAAAKKAMEDLIAKNQNLIDALGANAKAVLDVFGGDKKKLLENGVDAAVKGAFGGVGALFGRAGEFIGNVRQEVLNKNVHEAMAARVAEMNNDPLLEVFEGIRKQDAIDEEMQHNKAADDALAEAQQQGNKKMDEQAAWLEKAFRVEMESLEVNKQLLNKIANVGALR
jgi:hypothetical protein